MKNIRDKVDTRDNHKKEKIVCRKSSENFKSNGAKKAREKSCGKPLFLVRGGGGWVLMRWMQSCTVGNGGTEEHGINEWRKNDEQRERGNYLRRDEPECEGRFSGGKGTWGCPRD